MPVTCPTYVAIDDVCRIAFVCSGESILGDRLQINHQSTCYCLTGSRVFLLLRQRPRQIVFRELEIRIEADCLLCRADALIPLTQLVVTGRDVVPWNGVARAQLQSFAGGVDCLLVFP